MADGPVTAPGDPAEAYARRVVGGEVPAGRLHRLCCERHLRDLARQGTSGFPFVFDWAFADPFLRFARKCRHYKGEWAGRHFEPSENQVFRFASLFGWRDTRTGFRRFTTAYNEIPRKNGKTFEAAIVALYATFFEHEPGAEGYCIATKREQAKRVWADCRRLVVSSGLRRKIVAQVANLHRPDRDAKLEPLGADADSTDGLNPQVIITDEMHAMKNRALLDVMETATGARRCPLHYQITTAGNDLMTPCGDQHDYAAKVLEGTVPDEHFFAFVAHADPGDDWQEESTWVKANPHYGVSVQAEDMRRLALKARHMPSAAAQFRQKRLNEWINTDAPSLSMDGWRAGQSAWEPESLRGQVCWAGVDLSSKIDLTALCLLFPPTSERPRWRLVVRAWTPGDTLMERALKDRAPYDLWVRAGWLVSVPGVAINHRVIREALEEARRMFDVQSVGFDPWHATQLAQELHDENGWPETALLEVPQTFAGLTSAEAAFKAAVLAGEVDARDSPLVQWCASNVVEQTDGKGNILFSKRRSRSRIDPIKAATIAWAVHQRGAPRAPKYELIIVGGGGKHGRPGVRRPGPAPSGGPPPARPSAPA